VRDLTLAGVSSVVARFWSVEDESTTKLMEFFYRYLERAVVEAICNWASTGYELLNFSVLAPA